MEILWTWTELALALPFKNCVRLGMALGTAPYCEMTDLDDA